jgi:predicted ATPase/GAF domain-containing protein
LLDVVQTRDGLCLVLEDAGLEPVAPGPGLRVAIRCAIGIASALGELHQREVALGTLNPASVLTNADGTMVRIVDWSGVWGAGIDVRIAPVNVVSQYTSPEQTGRINRSVDYRSDFYALGAVLYQWLANAPPFASDDPLELIHAHVARIPRSVSALDASIPEVVSGIVAKLLAKSPDERYQSARGLLHDLRQCERVLDGADGQATFPLGTRDISDRFRLPQKLYGRQPEQQQLLEAFNDVAGGRTRLVLVTGYAGAGKTTLIGELARPIALQHGRFSVGKFDQVVRNIPYGAIVQAFRGLVWQLLSESETGLAAFRQRLTAILGANVAVLAEIIPEIELVAGPQPPPRPVDPAEAQNRFRYVIQSFVGSMAAADHPLVLVLDDLQWADPATLNLLHALLTSPDLTNLLIIGAYRDNEVDPDHPLTAALAQLRAAGARVTDLPLAPLAHEELARLLQDTLHSEATTVDPLARLIQEKTDGNPFFVTQFLHSLQQDGLFRLDQDLGRWTFDIDAIARTGTTDNVIELMTRRIRGLAPAAQQAATLAACIGSQFELDTFLAVSRQTPESATAGLAEVIAAGLISVISGNKDAPVAAGTMYGFLHDRVQQAAYELIPLEKRIPLHLDIGRLLLARHADAVPEDRLFELVNHLTVGRGLIEEDVERMSLARLSLAAARKAKLSAAYQTAAQYAATGLELLPPDGWNREYQLAFDLHLEAAESQYLTGAFDSAERVFESVLDHAATPLEKAKVHAPRMVLYENLSRWPEAIASGRDSLALLGIRFPNVAEERLELLELEVIEVERDLGDRSIAALIDLPVMADEGIRTAMRILRSLWASAYISGDHVFARLISARMVRLSLQYGTCEDSAYGYVTHAITVGPVRRDYQSAFEWGMLALAVNERMADPRLRAKVHQQFQAHVNLWRRPFETCIVHAREARRSGLEGGDFTYAAYGAVTESWSAFLISRDLEQFVREFTPTLALLDAIRMSDFSVVLQVMLNWARALRGQTASPVSLSDDTFDEEALMARYARAAPFFLTFFQTARLHLALVFDEPARALAAAEEAWKVVQIGTVWPVLVDAWGALAIARAWEGLSPAERVTYRERFDAARASVLELAGHAPENFRCFALMLAGEAAWLDGRPNDAGALFDEAIDDARRTGACLHEAMANDLVGQMWLQRERHTLAAAYIAEARRCYNALHADAKVAQLDTRYGALLASLQHEPQRVTPSSTNASDEGASLDMATVLKVANAVAVEMDVEALLEKLMRFALENAGAQRGVFLQERENALMVEAEASVDRSAIVIGGQVPFEESTALAHSVVRYVRRTCQAVVIDDATRDERVANDPYITRMRAKSILCVPVEHQGRLRGILYLENNLTTGGFTPARIVMMRALAAQTAISLENARLYAEMKGEVALRRNAEAALRSAMTELEVLKNRLETENVYLQEEIRTQHNFDEIVGNSPALIDALRQVERVAPTETTVLIVGETGCGKELFARAVHSRSTRKMRPLVKVNCGAIAPGLVESELFGHVKGAFTGAVEKRVGRFEVADGGTIFLDEVGELPLEAQVKLLRVLQEQEFEPVGSSRTIRVSVRVIAATNRDLEQAVREGRFRADLLYRLNVFPIEVPPLRARRTDIPLLAGFFVSRSARRVGKTLDGFSGRSMERMMEYSWPGNVRELHNLVERSAILAEGTILTLDGTFLSGPVSAPPLPEPSSVTVTTLEEAQRQHIINALRSSGGIVEGPKGAANRLGLHPNTLRSRMKKLGIQPQNL